MASRPALRKGDDGSANRYPVRTIQDVCREGADLIAERDSDPESFGDNLDNVR